MVAQITPLSDPPSRTDPENFVERSDTFMSELPVFAIEANVLAAEVNAKTEATVGSVEAAAFSAATATTQADLAMGYRNTAGSHAATATTKAGEASTSASAAEGFMERAETAAEAAERDAQDVADALASVADGPVTRVNWKTGDVILTSLDIAPRPTASEIEYLDSEVAKSWTPKDVFDAVGTAVPRLIGVIESLLPEAAPPGAGVIAANTLPTPDWLCAGVSYLTAAYPLTAKALGRVGLSGTGATGVNASGVGGLSSSRGKVVGVNAMIASGVVTLCTFLVDPSGVITAATDTQITFAGVGTSASQICTRQSVDGTFCSVSLISDDKYFLAVLRWNAALQKWSLVAKVFEGLTVSNSSWRFAHQMSDDGTKIWVPRITYDFSAVSRYDINTSTGAVSSRVSIALSIDNPIAMHVHSNRMLCVWYGTQAGGGGATQTRWGIFDLQSGGAVSQVAVGAIDSSSMNFSVDTRVLDGREYAFSGFYSSSNYLLHVDMTTAEVFTTTSSAVKQLVGILAPGVIAAYSTASPYTQGVYKTLIGITPTVISVEGYSVSDWPASGTVPVLQVEDGLWVLLVSGGNLQSRKPAESFQIPQPVATLPTVPYTYYFRSFDT